MPDQIVPINNLSEYGLNKDHPPVSLPPNAFTDAKNVRFRHGSVYKMEGEKLISHLTPSDLGVPNGKFTFITEWSNPNLSDNNSYYIIVIRDQVSFPATDHIVMVYALPFDLNNIQYNEIGSTSNLGNWQSCVFQGGFSLILNNGIDIPYYLLDTETGIAFDDFELKSLPNWDSYFDKQKIIDLEYDEDLGTEPEYSVGYLVDYTTEKLIVEAYDVDGNLRGSVDVTADATYIHNNANNNVLYVTTDTDSNTTVLRPHTDTSTSNEALLNGERFVAYRQSLNAVNVRCNLIKPYRDLLIAGDLRTIDITDGSTIRQLPGLIRTSNIASPGSLPTVWNPYVPGANTADEIQLTSSGIVRDMVPLQNSMVIYTDRSIHTLTLTGNTFAPFSVIDISNNYGAMTLDSVVEFDGRHMVIGNNDIYLFGGHPGSIQSLAEDKVRDFFYNDLNSNYLNRVYMFRNLAKDEIWIQYPSGVSQVPNKSLIYNYKNQTWTIREMSDMNSGFAGRVSTLEILNGGNASTTSFTTLWYGSNTVAGATSAEQDTPIENIIIGGQASPKDFDSSRRYPIFCNDLSIFYGEADDVYSLYDGDTYESYFSRIEFPVTPEFDVEQLKSLALWSTRYSPGDISLHVYVESHDYPAGDEIVFDQSKEYEFIIGKDYKLDVRKTGRFIDYKITDKDNNNNGTALPWSITGMQAKIGKRGER